MPRACYFSNMKLLRRSLLLLAFLAAPAAVTFSSHESVASVSIAVPFDSLVKDADVVAVVIPQEAKSVWEDGRIYTYTRVKVEQGIAGELGAGSEGWIRTLGGAVGKVGQMVDGEPVLTNGKSSLLFMRKFKAGTGWEVSARAQGQYPVVVTDDAAKTKKVIRSANVGVLYPPKAQTTTDVQTNSTTTQSTSGGATTTVAKVRLAQEVIHDRPLDEVTKEIATAWKRLHPPPAK